MSVVRKIRKIWHDVFYFKASKERLEFALRCQDVTHVIDLHEKPTTIQGWFRFWLHLSLCQACKNYYNLSQTLSKAVKAKPSKPIVNVDHVNKALLEKYSVNKNKSAH